MIATIGYERASLADFVATLKLADIEILIDIRDRAQSRRPGFSKSALREAVEEAGVRYFHFKELGDPKEGRDAARSGDFASFRKIYHRVIETPQARDALEKIEKLAADSNICLMCFERDQTTCHRKIVSDQLEKSIGMKARHLGVQDGAGKPTVRRVHDLNQGAAASV